MCHGGKQERAADHSQVLDVMALLVAAQHYRHAYVFMLRRMHCLRLVESAYGNDPSYIVIRKFSGNLMESIKLMVASAVHA